MEERKGDVLLTTTQLFGLCMIAKCCPRSYDILVDDAYLSLPPECFATGCLVACCFVFHSRCTRSWSARRSRSSAPDSLSVGT